MKKAISMQTVIKFCGIFIALNGLVVVFALLSNNASLIEISPNLPSMQLNTAICFTLCGFALYNLDNPNPLWLKIIGILVIIIALIANTEYTLDTDTGIERYLFSKYFPHYIPGKISPNSALDFLFSGIVFCLFGFKEKNIKNWYIIMTVMVSSLIASFALVTVLEFFTGINSEKIGTTVTLMSVHSAICFIMLGMALITQTFTSTTSLANLFSIPIFFALLSSVFYISYSIKNYEDIRFYEATHNELLYATQAFSQSQINLYRALNHIKQRWSTQGGTPENWFEADATAYLNDYPTLIALAYVNPSFHIAWVYPHEKYKKFIGFDYKSEPERAKTMAKAVATHLPQTTSPIRLLSNHSAGFIYMNPLYNKDKFDGLLVATFNAEVSFNALFKKTLFNNYYLFVTEENMTIFTNNHFENATAKNKWSQNISFVVNNKLWNFELTPKPDYVKSKNSFVPVAVLISGMLISIITALAIFFGLKTRQAEAELRWNKDWLQGIVDATHHTIIATDMKGHIVLFNHAAENMLGYTAAEMINLKTPEVFHNSHEIRLRAEEMSKILEREIKPGFETFTSMLELKTVDEREWEYIRKDNTAFPVWLSITPLRVDNQIKGYVGIAQDISDRKALDAMKNEFISIVSHELRTPITSIQGVIGLLLGGALGKFSEKAKDMLAIAHSNCERLIRLINDILDIEKIDAGKMELKQVALDLNKLVAETITTNETYAEKYGVLLKFDPWPDNLMITGDSDRLQQVFTNLLSNAIKFSPSQGTVTVKIKFTDNQATINFIDRGPGIPDAFQKIIFQKFSQADSTSTRVKGGTGLGLSISKAIAEKHGGDISFKTQLNKGTTFTVTLPAWLNTKEGQA